MHLERYLADRMQSGLPYPLGATCDDGGTNFALFSEGAHAVELCLFDAADNERRIALERSGDVWHGYLEGVRPGQRYGYRVHGPYVPSEGLRFNAHKLLLDPYARAFTGELRFRGEMNAYQADRPQCADMRDSAPFVPRCVVTRSQFDWHGDAPPRRRLADSVIYEAHVRGMTMQHPDVPEALRGTYLGLAEPKVIEHLVRLGVTAIELLPVHQGASEAEVTARGRTNYWNYSPLGFFAPELRYATHPERAIDEFKTMVRALHQAGLEVIVDVVFNHSCEGGGGGPTVCFRGIDNAAYYHVDPAQRERYVDHTGCGNSLNASHERVMQLVLDSLRYWVSELHVDGFRFDLAPTLGRAPREYDRRAGVFAAMAQDPTLAGVKLIAEPWDVGNGGYRLGDMPARFVEWNDKFRDTTRRFWRGDTGQAADLATRLTGSSDAFYSRGPLTSINFVTAHDGFTLRDLVSFQRKHNEANGEDNRDGAGESYSSNSGVEGLSAPPEILAKRERLQRSLLATLCLSQGVPMLTAGDEMGRTQGGNNNAYCQDNATSWIDWKLDAPRQALLDFTRELIALRRELPVLRRGTFFDGRLLANGQKDLVWLEPSGKELEGRAWHDASLRVLGMLMNGDAARDKDIPSPTVLVWMNAGDAPVEVHLPGAPGRFVERLNTADAPRGRIESDGLSIGARSLSVLVAG